MSAERRTMSRQTAEPLVDRPLPGPPVQHFDGCPAERIETSMWEGATVTRCIDCGAHHVDERSEPPVDQGVRFEPAPQPTYREVYL